MTIQQIKQIKELGYKIFYLNDKIELHKSSILEDYYFFLIPLVDKFSENYHYQKLSLTMLDFNDRHKIYVEEKFYNDSIETIENTNN
jgi:hypothetical protein